jgi:hypothetical protein
MGHKIKATAAVVVAMAAIGVTGCGSAQQQWADCVTNVLSAHHWNPFSTNVRDDIVTEAYNKCGHGTGNFGVATITL